MVPADQTDQPQPREIVAPWRIGVDVGGTFTDLVLIDARGARVVAKVPSVPADPSRGVLDGLGALADRTRSTVAGLLGGAEAFVHGSTVATNIMLEGTYARVGLLCTEGFRDVIEIRRGLRRDQWNHREPYPPVLVPRHRRRAVPGRIDADGSEHHPLTPAMIEPILGEWDQQGVQAVAVAFMNSYANPDHERRVAQVVTESRPELAVCESAELSPLLGEYERTSTAVVNAGLMPKVGGYLQALQTELVDLGLGPPLLLVQSNGGVAPIDSVARRPVQLLLSGPAAVVGGLARLAERYGDLISMEIGGTSCDVVLMSEGRVETIDQLEVAGYHVSTPSIDIHTIGAGGGTFAWVDGADMLRIGPRGAGAVPGPACYGRGGTRATVTDAQLVLGRLRPVDPRDSAELAGGLDLDMAAARAAIEADVAAPLGLSVEAAAVAIIDLADQHLLGAVEHLSIERGHSPRNLTLVAAGGAGPMHAAAVAAGLGCRQVVIPAEAGVMCAAGMLGADLRQDYGRVLIGDLDGIDWDVVRAGFDELADRGRAGFGPDGLGAAGEAGLRLHHEIELHHPGQSWTIRVEVDPQADTAVEVRARFESEYERLYGHVQVAGTIMVASLRLVLTAAPIGSQAARAVGGVGDPEPLGRRRVWFRSDRAGPGRAEPEGVDGQESGWVYADVYERAHVVAAGPAMAPISGPALIQGETTTVVVGPGDSISVDAESNLVIALALSPAEEPTGAPGAVGEVGWADDPVTVAVTRNRLDQITRQMGWVMTRTARSTIFSQSHDFSCFITTADGTLVANADGIPIHTGGGGFAVRALLGRFAGRISPGDVFVLSDPYVAGGNHLPDWVIARPVFAGPQGDQTLVGFCCNRAHQSDIGGGLAGTYNPEATEIWQEGIRLPVLKLIDAGEVRDDLWELLMINSRTPELLDGDLLAMIGSTRIGADRIVALVDEFGVAGTQTCLEAILDHGETRMRQALAEVGDGTWAGEDRSDNDCFGPADIAIKVQATVSGDSLTLDFTGSSPQIVGFKNSSLANTYSSAFLAVSSFFDADIPRNEGTYRAITVVAPEGSIVNARPPAPMTMNTVFVAHEIVTAVWAALAQADPTRACAAWSKTMHGHVTGRRPDGSTWVMYHWHAMGTPGATGERDGFAQMGHLISLGGLELPNLEFHEQQFPVRYRRHEQRCDNAGPGQRRGGTGVVYEADVLVAATWSFRAEGMGSVSGHGVLGGGDGGVGNEWIEPADAEGELFVPPKYGVVRLGPATMVAETPGGGGWGDPFTRDPALVAADVRDGVVSVAAALANYGVVIDPATGQGHRGP